MTEILVTNFKGRQHLEHIGMAGRMILKWILQTCDVRVWTELTNMG
jgi:hypothetical protein